MGSDLCSSDVRAGWTRSPPGLGPQTGPSTPCCPLPRPFSVPPWRPRVRPARPARLRPGAPARGARLRIPSGVQAQRRRQVRRRTRPGRPARVRTRGAAFADSSGEPARASRADRLQARHHYGGLGPPASKVAKRADSSEEAKPDVCSTRAATRGDLATQSVDAVVGPTRSLHYRGGASRAVPVATRSTAGDRPANPPGTRLT